MTPPVRRGVKARESPHAQDANGLSDLDVRGGLVLEQEPSVSNDTSGGGARADAACVGNPWKDSRRRTMRHVQRGVYQNTKERAEALELAQRARQRCAL